MDVRHQLKHLEFYWNSEKAAANMNKHGLTFERACEVFLDPLLTLFDASAGGEQRFAAIGEVLNGDIVYVVHVEFNPDTLRIISARYATRTEKSRYANNG